MSQMERFKSNIVKLKTERQAFDDQKKAEEAKAKAEKAKK
jgi:hypothetical protein